MQTPWMIAEDRTLCDVWWFGHTDFISLPVWIPAGVHFAPCCVPCDSLRYLTLEGSAVWNLVCAHELMHGTSQNHWKKHPFFFAIFPKNVCTTCKRWKILNDGRFSDWSLSTHVISRDVCWILVMQHNCYTDIHLVKGLPSAVLSAFST